MSPYQKLTILFGILLGGIIVLDIQGEVSLWYYVIIFLSYVSLLAVGSFVLSLQLFTPVLYKGKSTEHVIALTFDDGPLQGRTDQLLDILNHYAIKATFFCIGQRVSENPELVKRMEANGHIIANHSYSHPKNFGFLRTAVVQHELQKTDEAIAEVIGKIPRFFRPPFGVTNPMIAKAIHRRKYVTVGWRLRSFDTLYKDSEALFKSVTKSVSPGDVVLFHDYSEAMLKMLPRFIEFLQWQGFRIVPLNELLNEAPYR
jgi:peptidoglycan-N-acetylglucosamine deacetylase